MPLSYPGTPVDLSGYVPYIGATADLNLGNYHLVQARTAITTTGTINNQALSSAWLDFTGTATVTLTGIAAATEGTRIKLTNSLGASNRLLILSNNSGSSSAANRFSISRTYTVRSNQSVNLIYRSGVWVLDDTALPSWNVDGNYLPSGIYTFGTVSGSSATALEGRFNNTLFMKMAASERIFYNDASQEVIRFDTVLGHYLKKSGSFKVLDWDLCQLFSSTTGNSTVDWTNCVALDSIAGAYSLDWAYRFLFDSTGLAISVNWENRELTDSVSSPAINWNNYWLMNTNISYSVPLLDWSTSAGGSVKIYDGYAGVVVGDFTNQQLNDSSGSPRVNWIDMYLYDSYNQVSVDWNSHALWVNAVLSQDWENRCLYATDGTTVVLNYQTQQTTAITGATVVSGTGGNVKHDDTFGGYTVAQVVAALRAYGLLA